LTKYGVPIINPRYAMVEDKRKAQLLKLFSSISGKTHREFSEQMTRSATDNNLGDLIEFNEADLIDMT